MIASNYVSVCKALVDNVRFNDPSPVGSPSGSPFDTGKLKELVSMRQGLLPSTYRSNYASALSSSLPDVVAQLKQMVQEQGNSREAQNEARVLMDTLVGAVRDWGESAYQGPLRRFEAVVSNLYRSFLSAEQRGGLGLPLLETVPPLVTFAATADDGPFTLPSDGVKQFTGSTVGVVSLPGSYAKHPLLWPALAHETGGHDVLHADPGLLQELARTVSELHGLPQGMGVLWANWMDETASDVYGLLNIGPTFALSLSSFFAALAGGSKLGVIRNQLPVSQGRLVDPHPVDLLRLHVAIGVVQSLGHLAVSKRHDWQNVIETVAKAAAGGATTIDVVDADSGESVQHLPLATMANAAKKVGKAIATTKLASLKGRSIQDIETWDDVDELAATNISKLAATANIAGMGDDAQLLAGCTMALFDAPAKYQAITQNLNVALDDSYARDPIFGSAAPHSALGGRLIRRFGSRTPATPLFPLNLD